MMSDIGCFKAICLKKLPLNVLLEIFPMTQGTYYDANCHTWIYLALLRPCLHSHSSQKT